MKLSQELRESAKLLGGDIGETMCHRIADILDECEQSLGKIVECEKRRAADLRHRKAWQLVKFSEERMAAAEATLAKLKHVED